MKKFLFTLATLLMAGSMFAGENYFYMDNITLTKEEAAEGTYRVVNVRAHFDEAVSAWQAEFTLPEGVTIGTQAKGSDLTLTYLGQFEDEETLETYYQETTYTPDLGTNATKTKVIVSVYTTMEYDNAHNAYGICWRPGNYEQMWRVRLNFAPGFKGGDIVLNSQASCGVNVMPPYTPCTLNPIDKTTEVRIKADKPEIAVTGDDYTKTVTITAEEGATIYYSTDGESYQVYTDPIVFNEEGTYKVYAYAEGPGEGVERKSKSDVAESDEFTIIAQEQLVPAPVPTISDDGTKVTAAIAGDTQHTYVLELWNAETETWDVVANPYNLPAQTYEVQTLKFRAYTKAIEDVDSEDSEYCAEYTVTIPAKEKDYAPTPTISKTEDGTKVQATVDKDGYEVVLMLEGENGYAPCDNPYTLPENTSYTDDIVLNFKAYTKKNGEYYDSPETEVFTVTIPHKTMDQAVKPKITFTPDNGGVNVKIEDYTEYTIKVNGTQVDPTRNEHNYYVEKGDVDKNIVVYAKNAPENMIPADTTATYVLAAKKVYEVADPTISVDNSDPTQTVITIKATEGDLTYTLTDEDGKPFTDYTVEVVDGKTVITIENGEEVKTVNVTATTTLTSVPEGYDEVENGEAKQTVQTPVYVQPQTAKPTIDVSFAGEEGHYYANVTFKNDPADPNAVIEYCLDDPTVEDNWMPYTGAPVVIDQDGSHTVYARATATGKATSEVADRTFELNQTATSVNELVNGKTVAGVRYFNMAGQEMQEANGITIVVTTYTDGTTSAVKVIK